MRALSAFALAGGCGACASVDLSEQDRQSFGSAARVTKELDGTADHEGVHLEAGWNSATGSSQVLEYAIRTSSLGLGFERRIGERGWAGVAGGLSWQHSDLVGGSTDLGRDDAVGPYLALQGGWMATDWLEPCARAELALYLPDFGSSAWLELGARLHLIEPAALFVGWRAARFNLNDLDALLAIEQVRLDASGLMLGLELRF